MTLLSSLVPNLGCVTKLSANKPAEDNVPRVKPAYEVAEDAHGYTVTVQLPGVAKDGLEITAQEGEVQIVGRRAWTPPSDWTVLYRETPRANFGLALAHGNDVDTDKISAELKDGILRLTLPKAEAAKPRKIIIS
jgi:HSP20 family molecular chaperone IbpA